jgi:hypothetical protein
VAKATILEHLHLLAQMWDQVADAIPEGWACEGTRSYQHGRAVGVSVELRGAVHVDTDHPASYLVTIGCDSHGWWWAVKDLPARYDHGRLDMPKGGDPVTWFARMFYELTL